MFPAPNEGPLVLILASSALMSLISLVGGATLALTETRLKAILLQMVAFAAGGMLGGALFHLIPDSVERFGNSIVVYVGVALGFTLFFAAEQFIEGHHGHHVPSNHQPVTYILLVADSLHNFIDGVVVGGAFCLDARLGLSVCAATAAHEIPHELGDFAVLIHGGWKPSRALLANFLSGLAFLAGGLAVYLSSRLIDVRYLLPLAAGNFLYIAAADLIPEVKSRRSRKPSFLLFVAFLAGLGLMLLARFVFDA